MDFIDGVAGAAGEIIPSDPVLRLEMADDRFHRGQPRRAFLMLSSLRESSKPFDISSCCEVVAYNGLTLTSARF
jgi:hypothetical protein